MIYVRNPRVFAVDIRRRHDRAMNRQMNAGHWRALQPDPRGRNAIDLPFTPAMAAAAARVLEEIRTSPAPTSDRDASSRGRNAGGVHHLPVERTPPVAPTGSAETSELSSV